VTRPLLLSGAVASALLLTGCGPYAPRDLPIVGEPGDVVGTWTRVDGDLGVSLELRADGGMTYVDVPVDLPGASGGSDCVEVLAESAERMSGEGRWQVWVEGQYDLDFGAGSVIAVPGGFFDFGRLHIFCTDPDSGSLYTFERED
jgi:hypothetical protein